MAKHPSVSDWKAKESILKASVRGFNVLTELPRLLKEEFPWLKDFAFGFFVEDDIPERRSLGWTHLKREHFDIDNFNEAIGLAHGLVDDSSGNLKWRDNFIMIMPIKLQDEIKRFRHNEFEKQFKRETQNTRYIAPGSGPEHEEASKASFEEYQVINQPGPERTSRGRKPKEA